MVAIYIERCTKPFLSHDLFSMLQNHFKFQIVATRYTNLRLYWYPKYQDPKIQQKLHKHIHAHLYLSKNCMYVCMYVCIYIYICIHAREHAQNYNTHVFSGGVNIGFQSQPHRGHTRSHDLPNQERASKLLSLDDWFGPVHGSWHFWWILSSSVLTIAPLNLDPKMNKRTLFHLARFEGHVYSWGKRITKQVLSKEIKRYIFPARSKFGLKKRKHLKSPTKTSIH